MTPADHATRRSEWVALVARWALGSILIYLGCNKALHPVDFLKILRQYELTTTPALLNFIAATLPWFEIFSGLLLLLGIAVRGAAAVSFLMLVPFSVVVLLRALHIHQTSGMPLCGIRFDCGCGTGEVVVCHKLIENSLLILAAAVLLWTPGRRWTLRSELIDSNRPKEVQAPAV